MDGTLVDSSAAVRRIWHEFAARFGLDGDHIATSSHGVRMIETIRRHAPHADATAVERELAAIELVDLAGTVALPGATELLAALHDSPVALVTSASRPLAVARMAAAGLPLPAVVVSAEDVPVGKPDPAPYLLAAERLGVDPADCVVFEDADAGIRSGLAAGARVVVIGDVAAPDASLPRIADYAGVTLLSAREPVELEL
jgi:mannitol-1-/sugar-/sorbitol-6-phosphatase